MNEKGIYDIELYDFNEMISDAKVALRNKSLDYDSYLKEADKIMESYPNLQIILGDDKEIELTKEDCKMLQTLFNLNLHIRELEEQEIFFLGGREAYLYFKNIEILKE